jgi:hypothetical protein
MQLGTRGTAEPTAVSLDIQLVDGHQIAEFLVARGIVNNSRMRPA